MPKSSAFSSILILTVLACALVSAQQSPTLGLIADARTVKRVKGFLTGDFTGNGKIEFVTYNEQQVGLDATLKDSLGYQMRVSTISHAFTDIAQGMFNSDKRPDLAVITEDPRELQVYLAKSSGAFVLKWNTPLDSKYDHIAIGDINNDGRADILLYGKKEPGIAVYLSIPGGSFKKPQVLFPDIAFSNVQIFDATGDKINDILGVDWVNNRILVYSGFGRMRFSNPFSLTLESEPDWLFPAKIDSDEIADLVAGFRDQGEVRTYIADGLGGYQLAQSIHLDEKITDLAVGDFTGRGFSDLAALYGGKKSLQILQNDGRGKLIEGPEFFAGASPMEMLSFSAPRSTARSIAILDSTHERVRVLFSSTFKPPHLRLPAYATAVGATGIAAADVNNDGWADVVVANPSSRTYSLFLNRKGEGLSGQVSYTLPLHPSVIALSPEDSTSVVVVATGKSEDKISVSTIDRHSLAGGLLSVMPSFDAHVLGISAPPLSIFTFDLDHYTQDRSVTRFQERSARHFAQTSLTPQERVLAAAVTTASSGRTDLLYLVYNKSIKAAEMRKIENAASPQPGASTMLFSMPFDDQPRAMMWIADVNNDHVPDIVINFLEPDNEMVVSFGVAGKSYAPPSVRLNDDIAVSSIEALQVADMNVDGIEDIVLQNSLDKTIYAYLGKGDGTFFPRIRLTSSAGIGGFAVADINHDGVPELLLLDQPTGSLRIISTDTK